jgi:hypothetical protein
MKKSKSNDNGLLSTGVVAVSRKSSSALAYALLFCLCFLYAGVKAQSNDPNTVYKAWAMLGESSAHIDVSYRVVRCGISSPNQVHLEVFNENPAAQTVNMTIVVKNNATNASFSSTVSQSVASAAIVKADCSGSALKIDLPSNYDPTNLTVTVTFN